MGVVWFHNRVPLGPDIPGIILLYDVVYTWHVFIHKECCCRCCSCSVPVFLLQQLPLFVILYRMAKNVAGSLNLIASSVFFLFIQTRIIFNYVPLGSTVAFMASIWLCYILGNDGHARSQGWRQPATAKPLFVARNVTYYRRG